MPVKVWDSIRGELFSEVRTKWDRLVTAEEHRAGAEELDLFFDTLLDDAGERVSDIPKSGDGPFRRAYEIGSSI